MYQLSGYCICMCMCGDTRSELLGKLFVYLYCICIYADNYWCQQDQEDQEVVLQIAIPILSSPTVSILQRSQ